MVSATIEKIRSRGYWDVSIHPARRPTTPLPVATLLDTLQRNVVSVRGWPVPFIDYREPTLRGKTSVGQDIDATKVDHYESWRFTTDAQFSQLRSISADWRRGSEATNIPRGAERVIEVWEILFYVTELVELAARLALVSDAGAFRISTELHGMRNRALVSGTPTRHLHDDYVSLNDVIDDDRTVPVGILTGSPSALAVEISIELLAGFGWYADANVLHDYQGELLKR